MRLGRLCWLRQLCSCDRTGTGTGASASGASGGAGVARCWGRGIILSRQDAGLDSEVRLGRLWWLLKLRERSHSGPHGAYPYHW